MLVQLMRTVTSNELGCDLSIVLSVQNFLCENSELPI